MATGSDHQGADAAGRCGGGLPGADLASGGGGGHPLWLSSSSGGGGSGLHGTELRERQRRRAPLGPSSASSGGVGERRAAGRPGAAARRPGKWVFSFLFFCKKFFYKFFQLISLCFGFKKNFTNFFI